MAKWRFFLFIFLCVFPGISQAETISNLKVVSIKSYQDYAVVEFEPSTPNSQNCASTTYRENHVFVDYRDSANDLNMHSTILSAYAMGKLVEFDISGCTSGLYGGIPQVYSIKVYDE